MQWIDTEGHRSYLSIPLVSEFLLNLYKKGMSSNSINTGRSALSFFSMSGSEFLDDITLKRLFN